MGWLRSTIGYQAAAVLLAGGVLASFAWYLYALSAITWQVTEFQRVRFIGAPVHLAVGPHTLWVEGPHLSARRFKAEEYRKELVPRVIRVDDQAAVGVRPLKRSEVFNTGPIEGRSLWSFTIDRPASYVVGVDVQYRLDVDVPSGTNLAIGRGVGLQTRVWPHSAVLIAGGAGGFFVVAAATALVRRRDLRRFLSEDARGLHRGRVTGR